jgi:hypothetical protein
MLVTAIMAALVSAAPPPEGAPVNPALLAPEARGYYLHPTKDGGYTYEEDGWRASIAPDGAVKFADRGVTLSSVKIGPLQLVDSGRPDRTPGQRLLYDFLHPHAPPDPWEAARAPISPYRADPRLACLPRDPCYFVPAGNGLAAVGASGLGDLTDAYMRWIHQDPYRRAKARFLAATQDLRVKLGARRHEADLRASLAALPRVLETLWADPTRAPVEKRQLIFQLWNEALDPERPEPGAAARATIERFVREHLPTGSADAFTDQELARFGAASGGAFAPYGPPPSR